MPKTLQAYGGFSSADIKNRADIPAQADMTISGSNVDCVNIKDSDIKNVLGESVTSVGALCTSPLVNKWSGFGPTTFNTTGNIVTPVVNAPYTMGCFAGYNKEAISPYFYFPTAILSYGSSFAGTSINISSFINLGEVQWPNIWPNGSWFILADGTKVANFTTTNVIGNAEKNITLSVMAPPAGQSKTYTVDTWIGNTSGGALNGKLTQCSNVPLTIRMAMTPILASCTAADNQNNRDTAVTALSLGGTETVGRIWGAGTGLGFAGNNFTGNFTVNADISAVPGGAYKRTEALCTTALMRATLKAYKVNNGITSATYTVATLVRILPATGFSYAVPAALLPITDDDNYYLYFDNLI